MSDILFIRADADFKMGTGHLMRMMALAEQWKQLGKRVRFMTASVLPGIEKMFLEKGFESFPISAGIGSAEDAAQTLRLAQRESWCVLDGYQFIPAYQLILKEAGQRLMIVDDEAKLSVFHGEAVLNQNIYAEPGLYKKSLKTGQALCGAKFALLRSEFRNAPLSRATANLAKRIMISFGGTDPALMTEKTLAALSLFEFKNGEVRIAVGPGFAERKSLSDAAQGAPFRVSLEKNPSMSEMMRWADLALVSSGSTCWELCAMGTPAVVIPVAENQVLTAEALDRLGIAVNLGNAADLRDTDIAEAVKSLHADPARRAEMSRRGRAAVDAKGVLRVTAFLSGETNYETLS